MLLLDHIDYLIQDAGRVVSNARVLVDGSRIAACGPRAEIVAPKGAETLDCAGCAVMPGLVNAHTHLWQMVIKGRRDDLALADWCDAVLAPFLGVAYGSNPAVQGKRLSYLWTALGLADMLHSGTTAFLDMDMGFAQEDMFAAAKQLGVRGAFGVEAVDNFYTTPARVARTKADILELLARYPKTPGALNWAVVTPSEINLCSDELLAFLADAAERAGAAVQLHADETRREADQCLRERGESTLAHLDRLGLLSPRVSAVHGVHLTDAEIELAARRGITVVYNPKSNMKLGSGAAPIGALREAGVNLALATDGPASNDLLDMLEEMRAGALLQKVVREDPAALCARDAFDMATRGGARMLGVDAGALYPGKLADLAVLSLDAPHFFTLGGDILPAIVYLAQAQDVKHVLVDGRFALRDGRVTGCDEAALVREAREVFSGLMPF